MSRCIERVIDVDGDQSIGVRAEDYGVTVTWFCGDKRRFSEDDLHQIIEDLELLSEFPDVWLDARDSDGSRFMAQVIDGELYANDHAAQGSCVPWKELKKTARKMI